MILVDWHRMKSITCCKSRCVRLVQLTKLYIEANVTFLDRPSRRYREADSRCRCQRGKVSEHPDVPVHRPDAARRGHRRQAPWCPRARDAEPRPPQRRERERGITKDTDRRWNRGPRQQPGLRAHAPEIDGDRRRDGIRRVAQLGDARPHGNARLRRRHHAPDRSRGDGGLFRRRLATREVRAQLVVTPDLVPEQRPRAHRGVHRLGEGKPLAPERTLPGYGDHRAARACHRARRSRPHHGAAAAHVEEGQAGRRRRRTAHHARRRRKNSPAERA